jgi:hypothetical protein
MLVVTTFTGYWRLGWLIKSKQLEGNTTVGNSEPCNPNIHGTLSLAALYYPINSWLLNPLTPNVPYRARTAPLTSKVAFYIFIQQI